MMVVIIINKEKKWNESRRKFEITTFYNIRVVKCVNYNFKLKNNDDNRNKEVIICFL